MRLRSIGCGLLAVILSLPLALPVTSHAGYFSDVNGHWAEFYISKVYNEHIIGGYPNGRFLPNKPVTRAEFIAMVNKTYDLDRIDSDEAVYYSDIAPTAWYYNDIQTAIAAGYAPGYEDNTFKPNTPITRQEAAVMLSNLIPAGKKGGNLKSFSDSKQVDKAAVEAMTKLIGKGYLGGYSDKKLHPADPITRAQAAKILSDVIDNEDIVTRKTVVDENDTKLTAKTYVGDVLIDEDLEEGSATIENCIILGDLIIEGGGDGTITLNNTRVVRAIVDKEDSSVRIVTKGTTVVSKLEANETCSLQSSGKGTYSFPDITVNKMADVTLKGIFPKIVIDGGRASLNLQSGEIQNLTVNRAGKYSDITLSGKAKITEATVDAECYFHGTGSITYLLANADDITYETKPDKMKVGLEIDRPDTEGDEDVSVAFKPKHRSDDVDIDTEITVTFNTSMKLASGGEIKDTDVSSFLTLHTDSKTGTTVDCTATINTAKKVITLTPKARLTKGTQYYVVLLKDKIKNAGGNKNDGESIYFTTEGDAPVTTPPAVTTPVLSNLSLTPADTSITASFTPNTAGTVYALATTSAISAPVASQITNAGKTAAATANTAGTLTITGLSSNTTYYVYALLQSSGTNSSIVPASTKTTISDATLSSLTLTSSGGSDLISGFNSASKTYNVTVPSSGAATVDVTVAAATNPATHANAVIKINDTTALSRTINLTAGSTTPISVAISADNKTASTYTINVTVSP